MGLLCAPLRAVDLPPRIPSGPDHAPAHRLPAGGPVRRRDAPTGEDRTMTGHDIARDIALERFRRALRTFENKVRADASGTVRLGKRVTMSNQGVRHCLRPVEAED